MCYYRVWVWKNEGVARTGFNPQAISIALPVPAGR
jgi:hypothetical protein